VINNYKSMLSALQQMEKSVVYGRRTARILSLLIHRHPTMDSENWDELVRWAAIEIKQNIDTDFCVIEDMIGVLEEELMALLRIEVERNEAHEDDLSDPRAGNTGVELTDPSSEMLKIWHIAVDDGGNGSVG